MKTLITCLLILAAVSMVACSDDNPAAPTKTTASGFNTSKMPIVVPSTTRSNWGNLGVDPDGNILVPADNGALFSISRSLGVLIPVAVNIAGGERLMCATYDEAADMIYVGLQTTDRIFSVDPSNGSSSLFLDVTGSGNSIQQLLMAPAGFGSLGGRLLMLTFSGPQAGLYWIDPVNPTVANPIVIGQDLADMDFAPDGTLYATENSSGGVSTVSATGTVTPFVTAITSPDGIAATANFLMIASSGVDSLYRVTLPAGNITAEAEVEFNGGFFPAGLVFDTGKTFTILDDANGDFTIDFIGNTTP